MKSKLHKILGVALTLTLVLSLGIALSASPVAADDDEWSAYAIPEAGLDGDWFMDESFQGVGPIARGIDDTLYAASGIATLGVGATAAGTSTWNTTAATLHSGIYSAEFSHTAASGSDLWAQFTPDAGTTMADLAAFTNAWSFWYYLENTANDSGPLLELKFRDPDNSGSFVDVTIMALQPGNAPATDAWTNITLAGGTWSVDYWGVDNNGAGMGGGGEVLPLLLF